MKNSHFRTKQLGLAFLLALALSAPLYAADAPQLIQPAELNKVLQGPAKQRPLVIQVGFRTMYEQAHVPGSEYVGAASSAEGAKELHQRVEGLPRSSFIVLYCGCCPWSHCPNVQPAYKELRSMGFRNVKVLYIESNFGADWVDKGYPVSKGQ
ncbi:MAG TPA: rhodanese-like domain-containing protein [Terriglobales bacterium]|nr:rhodanese-like domain-containing protein [Terriglobales bacterium]